MVNVKKKSAPKKKASKGTTWEKIGKMPPLMDLALQIGVTVEELEDSLVEHIANGLLKIEDNVLYVNWIKSIPSC